MRITKSIRKIATGFLIILYALFYANVKMFTHVHVNGNLVIVHSHIHKKNHTEVPLGGHTNLQLILISSYNYISLTDAICDHIDLEPHIYSYTVLEQNIPDKTYIMSIRTYLRRAPPAMAA